ncbi:MAG: hypothetical protein KDA28_09075, partial [Phycisphaerales bacterium]|nr:hypothetical protein [Phycisphaerales bacterium]
MAEQPFEDPGAIEGMSLVEIAEHLQKVTRWIETERAAEREARRVYDEVASRAEDRIERIRTFANALLAAQARQMSTFEQIIEPKGTTAGARPRNVSEAILALWANGYDEPLTTDEIARALLDRGY